MDTFTESNDSTQTLGRKDAWAALYESVTSRKLRLMYVWGPPGSGKTFLVQHFSDCWKTNGHTIVWSSFRQAPQSDSLWWQNLLLQFDLVPAAATLETLRDAMIERCRIKPFVWVVDDCDSPCIDRDWVVQTALNLTLYGGATILTGRTSPFQLWPQSDVQSRPQSLELTDWDSDLTQRILKVRGITDPSVLQHAIGLTHGRPKLVSAIVDGMLWLERNQVPVDQRAFMADSMDLSGFLIEQMCHPGSRRLMWNAGRSGDNVDTMIAAAAVVPVFNRDWMIHMVGRNVVTAAWDRFIALPLLNSYLGGYYGLFPELRQEVMSTVHKMRPWTWEHWIRQAVDYYFAQIISGRVAKQYAWDSLFELIRTDLGRALFAPDPTKPLLEVKRDTTAGASNSATLVYLTNLAGHRVASAVGSVEDLHTLRVADVTVDPHYPEAFLDLVSTLASTFYLYDEIVWGVPRSEQETLILQTLRFTPQGEEWQLDISGEGFAQWLASMTRPPKGGRPAAPVRAVQDVLRSIRQGKEHYGTEVSEFWTSVSSDGNFRSWFLDALHSADLGERVDGKSLLVLYYLDRRGTHEELAEMLHVSRATYFRNHRVALKRLAQAVFD